MTSTTTSTFLIPLIYITHKISLKHYIGNGFLNYCTDANLNKIYTKQFPRPSPKRWTWIVSYNIKLAIVPDMSLYYFLSVVTPTTTLLTCHIQNLISTPFPAHKIGRTENMPPRGEGREIEIGYNTYQFATFIKRPRILNNNCLALRVRH